MEIRIDIEIKSQIERIRRESDGDRIDREIKSQIERQ